MKISSSLTARLITPIRFPLTEVVMLVVTANVNRNARHICSFLSRPILERGSPRGVDLYSGFLNTLDRNFSGQPARTAQKLANLALQIAPLPSQERFLRCPIGDAWEIDPLRAPESSSESFARGSFTKRVAAGTWGETHNTLKVGRKINPLFDLFRLTPALF